MLRLTAILFAAAPVLVQGQGAVWTQFEMNQADESGRFLWTESQNWNRGLPSSTLSVEIGDDNSGKALHCVIPAGHDAVCQHFELAEHGRTQGTTLRIEKGASLAILGGGVLSKDRESWLHVDGALSCVEPKRGLRLGGPWGRPGIDEPASCHLIIGPEGSVDAWFIGISTDYRGEDIPSVPWGEKYWSRSTGSEIVVNGGSLRAAQGLRMSTTDASKPGLLRLAGTSTFFSEPDGEYGIDVWCGTWQIDGGEVEIDVGDIELHGNKFETAVSGKTGRKVGAGLAVLEFSGDGVSTIRARRLDFVDAAFVDVSALDVAPGTYTLIDGSSIGKERLHLADGTDLEKWKLHLDREKGDVMLIRKTVEAGPWSANLTCQISSP